MNEEPRFEGDYSARQTDAAHRVLVDLDICYCLDQVGDGGAAIAAIWKERRQEKDIVTALEILRSKFRTVDDYGPRQVVDFHQSPDVTERGIQAQRAFQLVQRFLGMVRA